MTTSKHEQQKSIGNDANGEPLFIGDNVLIEEAWEDDTGSFHDEYVTIAGIREDHSLRFRIGHWKERKQRDQKIQAYLNMSTYETKDVIKQ